MRKRLVAACAMLALMLVMSPASIAEPRHPQIHAAIESLRNAKEHLEHAAHDFGGHKADALHAIDEAIHQLEICMKYD